MAEEPSVAEQAGAAASPGLDPGQAEAVPAADLAVAGMRAEAPAAGMRTDLAVAGCYLGRSSIRTCHEYQAPSKGQKARALPSTRDVCAAGLASRRSPRLDYSEHD